MLIGVDHGNKQIKTVHCNPFVSGLIPQYILSKGTGDTLLQTGHKGVAMNRFNLFVAMINANKHM